MAHLSLNQTKILCEVMELITVNKLKNLDGLYNLIADFYGLDINFFYVIDYDGHKLTLILNDSKEIVICLVSGVVSIEDV